MNFRWTAIVMSAYSLLLLNPAFAEGENPKFDKAAKTAQTATDAGDFKKAELGWTKALQTLEASGEAPADANLEMTLKRLAQAMRQNGKYMESLVYLKRAADTSNKLSLNDNELVTESGELCKFCRLIDPDKLGPNAAKVIKENKASLTVVKDKDGQLLVTVTIPDRIEHKTGNDKVDQIAMEKAVTFNLTDSSDGTVQVANIKGFKIHSVEKQMWVNLLGVNFAKPGADGSRDAAVTAGKMGVTKTVTKTIDGDLYQPIACFVQESRLFGQPLDIAIVTNGAAPASVTTTTTTSAVSVPASDSSTTTTGSSTTTTSAGASTVAPAADLSAPGWNTSSPTVNKTAPAAPTTNTNIDTTTVIEFKDNSKNKKEDLPKEEVSTSSTTKTSVETSDKVVSDTQTTKTETSTSTRKHRDNDDDDDDDDDDKRDKEREKRRDARDRDDD
ncbi:MAG: hypothetical protein IAF58_17955 [Leptolyngbya sp.]|nr:hypothetical protein [Candidatus Melainabacteria bacterium]